MVQGKLFMITWPSILKQKFSDQSPICFQEQKHWSNFGYPISRYQVGCWWSQRTCLRGQPSRSSRWRIHLQKIQVTSHQYVHDLFLILILDWSAKKSKVTTVWPTSTAWNWPVTNNAPSSRSGNPRSKLTLIVLPLTDTSSDSFALVSPREDKTKSRRPPTLKPPKSEPSVRRWWTSWSVK